MRIALFTDSFLPGVGGTEKAVLGLANGLTEKGHEVMVFCPSYKKQDDSVYKFKVVRCGSIRLTNNDFCGLPGLSCKFKKQLKDFKPEVIHCQSVSPLAAYALKYGKKKDVPVVITVHTKFRTAFSRSVKSKTIVNIMIKNLVKKLNKMKKVFTVSHDMIAELHSYGFKGEIEVIRNGAMFERIKDVDALKPLATEKYDLQNEKNILLYVGHIVKFKNLQFTLDALKIVKEEIPDFKMLFVGHGFDDAYFKKYASNLGLEENVLFTGAITDQKLLSSLYSVGELFVFPSIFDNDPLTIVEAALHKVPAITLKDTGSSERITNEVSGFVMEHDVQVFAEKIIYLLKNKEELKKAGENAEKMIPKLWETTAGEYLEEYKKLVK